MGKAAKERERSQFFPRAVAAYFQKEISGRILNSAWTGKGEKNLRKVNIMIRKVILVALLVFFSSTAVAFAQKALTGYGGLEWGDSTSKFKQLEPSAKILEVIKDFQSAVGSGKNAKIGIESTTAPRYRFYKEKYYQFSIGFGDERDFTILEDALTVKYGPPKSEIPIVLQGKPNTRTGIKLYWEIENKVSITLRWSQINQGELVYGYIPILEEIAKDQKESIKDNL